MITGVSPALERILEAGNSAPSGENCQPWQFRIHGSTIEVHLLPERDESAYGWGQRGSYMACGAAIENIGLAANAEYMRADITLLPSAADPYHIATLTLTDDASVAANPLAAAIPARITNRKPYRTEPLTQEERAALMAAGQGASVSLIEDRDLLKQLGRVGSTNEEVMLANKSLHQFFFSHVTWTKEEDEAKKIGFYIKTLELPPPAVALFTLFKHWGLMRILAALGFNRVVAAQNAATNAAVSAIAAVRIAATEPRDFIEAGRVVERLWLAATALGLSCQPLTGVLFFHLALAHGAGEAFSPAERALIEHSYATAARITATEHGHLAFMLRIGHADAPSAHAIRFPLAEVVTIS